MKNWWISQTPCQQRETQNGEVPLSRWRPRHAGRQSKNGVWPRRRHLPAATQLGTQRGKRGSKPSWESRSFRSSSSGTWELPACVGSAPPPLLPALPSATRCAPPALVLLSPEPPVCRGWGQTGDKHLPESTWTGLVRDQLKLCTANRALQTSLQNIFDCRNAVFLGG